MKPEVFKWISAGIIWLTTLIGSSLPLCITAIKWNARLESMAGGVFLGAGLAHLLNDSFEELENESKYPLSAGTALLTFVLLTAVELFSYGEHDEEFQVNRSTTDYDAIGSKSSLDIGYNLLDSHFGTSNSGMTIPTISLFIIMNVHSAIEGLALGIMTKWKTIIAIFCAIVGHKPMEAFALSLIILKDRPKKFLFWVMVVFYTLMSPAGLIAGIILVRNIQNKLLIGLIAAFSAGTFLFVGCHVWSEMFENKKKWGCGEKSWHFGFFSCGVIWMILIAVVETIGSDD